MLPKNASREVVPELLDEHGGLRPGVSRTVHRESGVPEADVYGVGSFFHLLSEPDATRVCQGISCQLADCAGAKSRLEATGEKVVFTACLGRCDLAPAVWSKAGGHRDELLPGWIDSVGETSMDLAASDSVDYAALAAVRTKGADWLIDELQTAGLQGRGGAGFPAAIKWKGVRSQAETERYIVLNADEGEPGTFKDREVMLRRPHLVVEGLAIAAHCLEARDVYIYVRGEFGLPRDALLAAVGEAKAAGVLDPEVRWHVADGHGAYICGEETALLEALEGKRGMPRMKPPFPVEHGFRGKPTLVQNVETIACVPPIVLRGGSWFHGLGRTQPGSKLYCLSGHVVRPGVYEAPLGISFAELLELAGGCTGTLQAFSPGGASSGFLPASKADVALDFKSLQAEGSMLGSAGIVVLDDSVDMVEAALIQAVFFEDESCGQCAPCRIGTQIIRQALERYQATRDPAALKHLDDVMWGMGEASICGLGQAAFLPLQSAVRYWPEAFGLDRSRDE